MKQNQNHSQSSYWFTQTYPLWCISIFIKTECNDAENRTYVGNPLKSYTGSDRINCSKSISNHNRPKKQHLEQKHCFQLYFFPFFPQGRFKGYGGQLTASKSPPITIIAAFLMHSTIAIFISETTSVTKTWSHGWNFLFVATKDKY